MEPLKNPLMKDFFSFSFSWPCGAGADAWLLEVMPLKSLDIVLCSFC